MLPKTKNLLIKGGIGALVVGALAVGYYMVYPSTTTSSTTYMPSSTSSTPSTPHSYGGAKTKHNKNHKKHNNKSKKHH